MPDDEKCLIAYFSLCKRGIEGGSNVSPQMCIFTLNTLRLAVEKWRSRWFTDYPPYPPFFFKGGTKYKTA